MASSSKQLQATLFLVAALLFLVCTRGAQAARPQPGSNDRMLQRAVYTSVHENSGSGPWMEMDQEEPDATRDCEGGEEGVEWLTRRTLVAHTDYIYTQGKHN
ncbi:phytosulfokines-like [Phragmites australis]|uniref:phytosulfokines-like n=1 Tax=Phragmites australis TaxID=29695 RepID=UPI002D778FAD|nr:phytosulfokines-like [Phragmites australis]